MQQIMGSLQWVSLCTRPDISTAVALLSQYQNSPSPGHLKAAKHIVKYLKGTSSYGINFNSSQDNVLRSFLQFPTGHQQSLTGVSDANWGPQDQSTSFPTSQQPETIELHKSRSFSGHIISLHGPVHWSSKQQSITARSSAESEIYATDECCKDILFLSQLITDLNLKQELLQSTTTIYNGNMACVQWSKNRTTRSIRHIQLRENAVREAVQRGQISVLHVPGKLNPSDILTKEDKDTLHYITLRDCVVSPNPIGQLNKYVSSLRVPP